MKNLTKLLLCAVGIVMLTHKQKDNRERMNEDAFNTAKTNERTNSNILT